MNQSNTQCNPSLSYLDATGRIPYSMTNDYMFRAILQKSPKVLKGLISSLLHLSPTDIVSIEITNPILLGESIRDKGFVLDIHICLNDNTMLDLEMQVVNEHNWPERSLSYLCRVFDNLAHGQEYTETMPAIHIGFLDFQPFEDNLEFYATYRLLNQKNHHLYSDKFTLSVLDLTHIDLATEEDKAYGIDHWARFFKATTWEELKMLSANNEYMSDVSQTLYECNTDLNIREQCYAREEQIKKDNYYKKVIAEQAAALEEKDVALTEQATEIARLKALLARQSKE